ncbi:MAG: AMP-dependent synthetase/ligase, partial [Polyangiales bacterium]
FLFITGRIKEQYKLENGKYVMPGPLEEELKISRYIANVMLHGANKPYNVALVVLDNAAIATWASELGIEVTDPAHDPRVEKLILGELRRLSSSFRAYEAPRRVLLVTDDFSTDNGFLTPTLKLKRRNVELRYGPALEALYIEPQPRPVRFATEAGARSP